MILKALGKIVLFTDKVMSPDRSDMHFVFVYMRSHNDVTIAKIAMGGSPKQGCPEQSEDTACTIRTE